MASKILVTASSGSIGSQIVKLLQASKADFVAGISPSESGKSFDFPTQTIDFGNKGAMAAAMNGRWFLFAIVHLENQLNDLSHESTERK
jgi:uncharacterized protein YbjT (DUF2867 family)